MRIIGLYLIPLLFGFSVLFSNPVFGDELASGRWVFPQNFTFGASSSSYQYEGSAFGDYKGQSIWDNFSHAHPHKILDGSNGDVAVDFYHRYKDDIKLMKNMGLDAFRMSISWPRILPKGKLSGGVSKDGIAFYNSIFNELLANGMKPFVTLFHWDFPQALVDEYDGFLSPLVIYDFKDFAEVCFKEFGDQVKYWMTFNEPYIFISGGYDGGLTGTLAPGRCSDRTKCAYGDAAIEPYVVAHHQLIAHAEVVKLYREKYKPIQKGEIGIVLPVNWMVPYSHAEPDINATRRALEFMYGWFAEPLVHGRYPKIMREIVGDRLPEFTYQEHRNLIGSFDFLGLNYYSGSFVINAPTTQVTSFYDKQANYSSTNSKGQLIGGVTGSPVFFDYPDGLYHLLVYTKKRYNNPTIYITENGYPFLESSTVKEGLDDHGRIHFYKGHLQAVLRALKEEVNVKGFFAWSFLDDYEWNSGFLLRFGLYHVDYVHGLKRIAKSSANWFTKFLNNKVYN